MIIPLRNRLTDSEFKELEKIARDGGVDLQPIHGTERSVYAILGDETSQELLNRIEGLPYVDRIDRIQVPYKLMSKNSKLSQHRFEIGTKRLGRDFAFIAGPCTVDPNHPELFMETAHALKEAGADMLRGGVWKPRTSPHSFKGNDKSLQLLLKAREETGLPINTEVMDDHQLQICLEAGVECLQIGARNALNYRLLSAVGEATRDSGTRVLLKRSIHMGPVSEFILAAEYIVAKGNPNVMLCPRGTSPGQDGYRNHPDESITPLLKEKTWAPVVVDPSHSVGKSVYVPFACLAAASYGADGLLLEAHINPTAGIGDDPKQSVTPETFSKIVKECTSIHKKVRKYMTRFIVQS